MVQDHFKARKQKVHDSVESNEPRGVITQTKGKGTRRENLIDEEQIPGRLASPVVCVCMDA